MTAREQGATPMDRARSVSVPWRAAAAADGLLDSGGRP